MNFRVYWLGYGLRYRGIYRGPSYDATWRDEVAQIMAASQGGEETPPTVSTLCCPVGGRR